MTNAEKLAKKLLSDIELFAEVFDNGICPAMPTCGDCPLHDNISCGIVHITEWLEQEIKEDDEIH